MKKQIRCKHCNRPRGDHKALTFHCPIGNKHVSMGFTQYSQRFVFEPKPDLTPKGEFYIRLVTDARACIGKKVYWDDPSSRYVMLRQGFLTEVKGKNLLIDGDWKWRTHLRNLRNFEHGGAFKPKPEIVG